MKRSVFVASLILAMAFFVMSCENNEIKEVESEIELKSVSENDTWGLHRHLVHTEDTCYCEKGHPLNCFDDIVIVAEPITLDEIRRMELQPLTTSAIWRVIVPYISNDKSLLSTLSSGAYLVRSLPNSDPSRVLCGVLERSSGDIVYTFQFVAR